MDRNLLSRRLEAALEKSRRENPDGPLSTYAWMWSALLRSSSGRVSVILRFASLVVVDACLLFGWTVARPIRHCFRQPIRRIGLATAAAGITLLMLLGPPSSPPPPPWSGVPLLLVEAGGLLRFEGQVVTDDDVRALVEHYDVDNVVIDMDPEATVTRLAEIMELLVDAGVVPALLASDWVT